MTNLCNGEETIRNKRSISINNLDAGNVDSDIFFFIPSYIEVFLPKFSISSDVPLSATLKEMGIINAFEDMADFSGISAEVKIKISKVGIQLFFTSA